MIIPSPERNEFYGIPVVGYEVVYQNGCCRRIRYWLKGHHNFNHFAKYVQGLTGPETILELEQIFPVAVFDVE